jgi:hypothetical protein
MKNPNSKYRPGVIFTGRFMVRPVGEPAFRPANDADAAIMRGMADRGDLQSDISSYFATNNGRVNEVVKGHRFPGVPAAPRHRLPPPGPPIHNIPTEVKIVQVAASFYNEQKAMRREQQKQGERIENMMRLMMGIGTKIGALETKPPRIGRRNLLEG